MCSLRAHGFMFQVLTVERELKNRRKCFFSNVIPSSLEVTFSKPPASCFQISLLRCFPLQHASFVRLKVTDKQARQKAKLQDRHQLSRGELGRATSVGTTASRDIATHSLKMLRHLCL